MLIEHFLSSYLNNQMNLWLETEQACFSALFYSYEKP